MILDTSILIAAERGVLGPAAVESLLLTEPCYISLVTYSELMVGLHRAKTVAIKHKRQAFIDKVKTRLPLLEINLAIAEIHAELVAEMQTNGNIINAGDIWIAATAIHFGHTVVTRDHQDFKRVKGLEILAI